VKKNSHSKNKTFHAHKPSGHQKEARYSMTKRLIIAIIAVFSLIIIFGLYIFVFNSGQPEQSEAITSLVETCARWCSEERLSSWCDFELSASPTVSGTCNAFSRSTIYAGYNVQGCPAIDCESRPPAQTESTCSEIGGVWEASIGGKCEEIGDANRFILSPTENPPVSGQICCTPIKYLE